MELSSTFVSRTGSVFVTVAVILLALGLIGYATGDEVALFPMMAALLLFTTGIGVLSVGRDLR